MLSSQRVRGRPTERQEMQRKNGVQFKSRRDHFKSDERLVLPANLHFFPRYATVHGSYPNTSIICSAECVVRCTKSIQSSSGRLLAHIITRSIFLHALVKTSSCSLVNVQAADPYRTTGVTVESKSLAFACNVYALDLNTSLYLTKAAHPARIRFAALYHDTPPSIACGLNIVHHCLCPRCQSCLTQWIQFWYDLHNCLSGFLFCLN